MHTVERYAKIDEALKASSFVSADDLAGRLGVSLETIRRDLRELQRRGVLTRVHGGAVQRAGFLGGEGTFAERTAKMADAKCAIGEAATSLVQDGQTIIIDVGTTAQFVARSLAQRFRGCVITPSLLVAIELQHSEAIEVIVAGGRLRGGDLALSGSLTRDLFGGVHADVAFLGSGGIDAEAGLTDYHLDEVATRRAMIQNSGQAFVLADSTKCDGVARYNVAPLSDLAGLVTDSRPSRHLAEAITRTGGRIILPTSEFADPPTKE